MPLLLLLLIISNDLIFKSFHQALIQVLPGKRLVGGRHLGIAAGRSAVPDQSLHKIRAATTAMLLTRAELVLKVCIGQSDALGQLLQHGGSVKQHVFEAYQEAGPVSVVVLTVKLIPQVYQRLVVLLKPNHVFLLSKLVLGRHGNWLVVVRTHQIGTVPGVLPLGAIVIPTHGLHPPVRVANEH